MRAYVLSIKLNPGYLIVLPQPFLHAKRSAYPVYPCQSEIIMLVLFLSFPLSQNKWMAVFLCVGGGTRFISKCLVKRNRGIMITSNNPLEGSSLGAGVLCVR